MKRTPLLLLVIACLLGAIWWGASQPAYAAKMRVSWTAPTLNTDGSPLTDLSFYRVEWGTCNPDGSFGTFQAGISVAATQTWSWIYPTGLNPVCARVFAVNSQNVVSPSSNVGSGTPPPTLSQPTH